MKNRYRKIKYVALALCALTLTLAFSSCKARPLASTKLAKTEVGKVGEYTVLYDEFYFLASNCVSELKDDYKDDPEGLKKAVWDKVSENITDNYAVLELCKKEGISYDEDELKDDVNTAIKFDIENYYDGSRRDYFDSQIKAGLTDRCLRFYTEVDILYSKLGSLYLESGVLPNTDEKMIDYIQENFVHTWHIAAFVNEGETREENLQKIEEAKALLESGTSMYRLIGSKYNEDVTTDYLSDTYGYYFPRGVMDEAYEQAAFSVKVGESAIVESKAKNGNGEYVDCIYLIQRLSTTSEENEKEIRNNLDTLSDMAAGAYASQQKENMKATLSFSPNDFAKSLDVTDLEPVKNGVDYQPILIAVACVCSAVVIVVAILVYRNVRLKKFQSSIRKSKQPEK